MEKNILIVDDEYEVRETLATILKKQSFLCHEASNAQEARKCLKNEEFDLLICDILMPGESGLSVVKLAGSDYPDMAVIILTGVDDPDIATNAFELGVYGYLIKPFNQKQLLITIQNALRRQELEKKERASRQVLENMVQERTIELETNMQCLLETKNALEENEEKLRTIVESSNDGISIVDRGNFLYVNPKWLEIYGFTKAEEVIGKPIDITIHPDDREWVCNRALKSRETDIIPERDKFRGVGTNGETIYLEVSATTITYNEKKAILSIIRDITENVISEEALKESEERFRAISETAHEAIIIIDGDGIIAYWNLASERTFGYNADEAIGKKITDIIVPERYFNFYKNAFNKFKETGKLSVNKLTVERIALKKGGDEFPIEVSLSSAVIKSTPHLIWIVRDLTERKKNENALLRKTEELDENRNKLQNALNEVSALIQQVAIKKDFGIRYKNPNLSKCYEFVRCNKELCTCYGQEAMRCWQIVGTFDSNSGQKKCNQEYDSCFQCEVFLRSCPDPFSQIGEHFNNMMHILESKNLELLESNQHLKKTQSQIIHQEKMASIGQLAAGVAHEINNPTGFIGSNLGTFKNYQRDLFTIFENYRSLIFQLEKKNNISTELANNIKHIRALESELDIDFIIEDLPGLIKESLEGTERIKKIVMDLKDFAHPSKKELVYTDINKNIDSTLNIVWNELKYKASVKKEYGDIPEVMCCPQEINQVFMNLLVNAAQALEEHGEILIKTVANNGGVRIKIKDTGKGIAEEDLPRIFDPFFTTKEIGKGTGLGLHLVYNIINKHEGKIHVASNIGEGTTFTIDIPANAH